MISKDNGGVALINVLTVEPENQQRVADLLVEISNKWMKHQPGFISANIHKSLDGTHVVNYAQWQSAEDYEVMIKNPQTGAQMGEIVNLAKWEYHLYEVYSTILD